MSEVNKKDSAGVSVVVPSYNHAAFVEKCLRSIMGQTLAPRELIVIDDGSRDGSPQIIERVLKDCPFSCELVARENRGLCRTLNEGLARSRETYFSYLGSDDIWLAEFLETRVSQLESRPAAALAYGYAYIIDEHDKIVAFTLDTAHYADGDARRMLLAPCIPQSSTVVYRRAPLQRHAWNEDARLEDYELFLRLSAEGEFALDAQYLSGWRRHGRNTSTNVLMMMEEFLEAQSRVAASIGLTPEELRASRAAIKYNSGGEFLMAGQRLEAVNLTLQNLGGAASHVALLRRMIGLTLPLPVVRWLDRRGRQRTNEQFGSISIDENGGCHV